MEGRSGFRPREHVGDDMIHVVILSHAGRTRCAAFGRRNDPK